MTQSRFFIVDPQLTNYQGHHFEYCQSVGEAAARRGLKPVVLANRRFTREENGVACRPSFRHTQYDLLPSSWRVDLLRVMTQEEISEADHVFLATAYFRELDELQVLFHEGRCVLRPQWHVMFRHDLNEFEDFDRWQLTRFFRWLNRQPKLAPRMHFYTDTEVIASQYAPYTAEANKKMVVLPIPQRAELLGACVKDGAAETLCVLYAGDARLEKGYNILPDAVEQIVKNPPPGGRTEFVLHSHYNVPGGERGIAQAHQRLKAMPNVSCPVGPFTPQEYYGDLARSDIVVLPYNPRRYAKRSSGALSEAIAAGKVTVAPERCWLGSQIDATRGVTYGANAQFGAALRQAIANFDTLHKGALAFAKKYRAGNNPDTLMDTLLRQAEMPWQPLIYTDPAKKSVLLICDYWVLLAHNGSGRVGRNQLRWLIEQGYEVHVLASLDIWSALARLDIWTVQPRLSDFLHRQKIEEFCRDHGVKSVGYAWFDCPPGYANDDRHDEASAVLTRMRYQEADFISDIGLRRHYVVDAGFKQRIEGLKLDFVLMNYIHNAPLLEKIDLKGAPVICETHDAMARQKAVLRGEEAPDAEEEAAEIASLSVCDGLIFISNEEQCYFNEKIPKRKPGAHLVPALETNMDLPAALGGCSNLAEIILAAGIDVMNKLRQYIKPLEASFAFDLFMVSSNHTLTAKSLLQFYHEVFLPFLKPKGVRLFIAGSLMRPWQIPADDMQVIFLGHAQNLEPLYAAAKIVLLPIYHATGTGIKTLEALNTGKALLGTSLAFRGISPAFMDRAALLAATTNQEFADKILAVLSSREARRANAAIVKGLAESLPGWPEYSEGFARLVKEVAPDFNATPILARTARLVPEFFEPDEMIQGFNTILRMVLMGKEPSARDCMTLLNAMRDPNQKKIFRRMFESFFVERAAPLAKIFEQSGFFSEALRWPGKNFADFTAALEARCKSAA